ncbi:uncharacterized protein C8R40DRAFT_1066236 [Lentinula edodes]|uniref:uncharacterized protein n=1 Tax=Lentinula edodes TaxID=5353 RepID=UPI001E8CA7DC|nr:uncharacterized protein C8R40DRAFT_1066236 [Lentinula edodes]KAH7880134.1 hypothetical protein C8R40DRAFT_1066236 [Lentinula edodes]
MSSPINYAKLFGFESVAAAGIFAALYAPLTVWFFLLLIRHRSYVVFTLVIFCQIRFVAFIIRAILAGSKTAAENLDLFIAGEVLFSVGFFGLLYGAYGLVMDRLMRSRIFFHLGLSTGVALGIVGIVETSNNTSSTIGSVFRKVSVIIFVVLTVLQAYQTVNLVIAERRGTSFGARHGALIFMLIAILLLLREIFIVATIGSTAQQNNEHLWYPLVALPELLCIILYAVPGLIPPKRSDIYNLPK